MLGIGRLWRRDSSVSEAPAAPAPLQVETVPAVPAPEPFERTVQTRSNIWRAYQAVPKINDMEPLEIVQRLVYRAIADGWTESWMTPAQMYDQLLKICTDLQVKAPYEDEMLRLLKRMEPLVQCARPLRAAIMEKREFKHIRLQFAARHEPVPVRPTLYSISNIKSVAIPPSASSRPSMKDVSLVMTPVTQNWHAETIRFNKRSRRAA